MCYSVRQVTLPQIAEVEVYKVKVRLKEVHCIAYLIVHFIIAMKVTESTAKLLTDAGYELDSRGPTYVKGKGTLNLYYVRTPFDAKSEISGSKR
jgi:hypothetical protein